MYSLNWIRFNPQKLNLRHVIGVVLVYLFLEEILISHRAAKSTQHDDGLPSQWLEKYDLSNWLVELTSTGLPCSLALSSCVSANLHTIRRHVANIWEITSLCFGLANSRAQDWGINILIDLEHIFTEIMLLA